MREVTVEQIKLHVIKYNLLRQFLQSVCKLQQLIQQEVCLAFYSSAPQLIRRNHEDTSLPFVDVYVFGKILG